MGDVAEPLRISDADEIVIRGIMKKLTKERIIAVSITQDGRVRVKTVEVEGEFLDGSGHFYIFEKRNGKWVKTGKYIWIS
jgi:hypothetical protein